LIAISTISKIGSSNLTLSNNVPPISFFHFTCCVHVVFFFASAGYLLNIFLYEDGWTALIGAAFNGHAAIVKLLIKEGADVDSNGSVSFYHGHDAQEIHLSNRNRRIHG
jgi:ankyrin repeat protein